MSLELQHQSNVELRLDFVEEMRASVERYALELTIEQLICSDPEHPTAVERKVVVACADKWMDRHGTP